MDCDQIKEKKKKKSKDKSLGEIQVSHRLATELIQSNRIRQEPNNLGGNVSSYWTYPQQGCQVATATLLKCGSRKS